MRFTESNPSGGRYFSPLHEIVSITPDRYMASLRCVEDSALVAASERLIDVATNCLFTESELGQRLRVLFDRSELPNDDPFFA